MAGLSDLVINEHEIDVIDNAIKNNTRLIELINKHTSILLNSRSGIGFDGEPFKGMVIKLDEKTVQEFTRKLEQIDYLYKL